MRSKKAERNTLLSLERIGWRGLFHDVRVQGVQVDLLMRDPAGMLVLIEVKIQNSLQMARLTPRQKARLFRVCAFLSQWEPIGLRLALLEGGKLLLLPVDSLTAR